MALNVLVVDDSSVTRMMIIKTLKMAGLPIGETFQAGNGQEGLDQLEENWIDIALVDINMPVMNGEEMIEKVRENPEWQAMPIIVVSTEGSQTRIERLLQKGVKFIHKPFAAETVREVISEITGIDHEPTESETDF
ncbi:MAG: response regulator [Phycisphaerae bacterium]|nr:response regulator [Phycisphaerae bacterium]